jgi:methylenetetrahydrofolate reductase (NADPH)
MEPFNICLSLGSPLDGEPPSAATLRACIAACAGSGLVTTFSISDLPGSAGAPSPRTVAAWVLEHGGDPVVTLAALGRRGPAFADELRAWQGAGVRRFLFVTGNHPPSRLRGEEPFDIDCLQMLLLLRRSVPDGGRTGPAPRAGAVVSLGKTLESELHWQYARLRRKVEAGAAFVVPLPAYDPRAWDELARYCSLAGMAVPLFGSVLVPDAALARRIAAGRVPGIAIPPALLERMLARDGREGLRLAAAAVAVLRGLGYQGAWLCGRALTHGEIAEVLEEAERLQPTWRDSLATFGPALPRFSYFREDPATGLNTASPAPVGPRRRISPLFRFSEVLDAVAFDPRSPVFRALVRVCRFCDARPFWRRALWLLEYLAKAPLYRCRMCGDCTLYACGFLCAESGCPKRMVNGPCGGSRGGRCEVPGAGTCLWVRAYDRLKAESERPSFPAAPIPPKDRRLEGTCSWVNYCLGRDHRGRPGGQR